MFKRIFSSLLVAIMLSACAATLERDAPEIVSMNEYRQFLAELRQDVEEGDPPLLNDREMQRYSEIEGRILTRIHGVDDVDEMSRSEQTELLNLHEALWATVRGRDDEQLVCRRVQQTGTNFRATHCRSLGDIRASQQNAQRFLQDMPRAPDVSD